MFSVRQKREIAAAVQQILRDTEHPELPRGEIQFSLHVNGAEAWQWADIRNNGSVTAPSLNPWNEKQDQRLAHDWQPIETAPKDGTPILVNFGSAGIHRVFWSDEPFGPGIGCWCVTDLKNEDKPLRRYVDKDIKGWMPLPSPPAAHAAHNE